MVLRDGRGAQRAHQVRGITNQTEKKPNTFRKPDAVVGLSKIFWAAPQARVSVGDVKFFYFPAKKRAGCRPIRFFTTSSSSVSIT